jgi:two-component system chemotaxis response regulator CheV
VKPCALSLILEKLLIEAMPAVAEKIFASAKDVAKEGYVFSHEMYEKTILFAEDSKAIQKYMSMIFTQLGLKSKGFDDGRQLLDYIEGLESLQEISMVFTDLEMPVASGHTVIQELRANPKTKKMPIIVHTSMTSDNNSREVLAMGADFLLGRSIRI